MKFISYLKILITLDVNCVTYNFFFIFNQEKGIKTSALRLSKDLAIILNEECVLSADALHLTATFILYHYFK